MSGYELFDERSERPFWADIVFGFRYPSKAELSSLGYEKFKSSWFYTTYYLMATKYLPLAMEKFRNKGGIVVERKLNNLAEIGCNYDVIVNCTGLGSVHLMQDQKCYPIRGQIYRVKAPFVKHFVVTDNHYVLLNEDRVILGGTHQNNDWRTEVDKSDSDNIFTGCVKLVPALKHCTVIEQVVGLRPGRSEVRLESENQLINNQAVSVIHCYGHGGSGLTLFYGCAREASSLAVDALRKKLSKL